jgi:alkylation response protein AidB-like acyl-CoA dehydrogenase
MGSRTPRSHEEEQEWRAWTRDLHAAGLALPTWPLQWGGGGARDEEAQAVPEVLAVAGAPLPLTDIGINLVGPSLLMFGSEEQQRRHLPGIADGTVIWTQLFSEPDAGSDLAAVRCRAVLADNGRWIVDGQKVWSTYAHIADWGYLIARTGAREDRHRGLSAFLVPMDLDGISIRPIREMTGTHDFNEVFFDGCELPAESLLGQPGEGWRIALGLLAEERRVIGRLVAWLEAEIDRLACAVASFDETTARSVGTRLGTIAARASALGAMMRRESLPAGGEAVVKIAFSEVNVELHQLALDVLALDPPGCPPGWAARWTDNYLYTRSYTISGGANEIMRNVVAKRVLELS